MRGPPARGVARPQRPRRPCGTGGGGRVLWGGLGAHTCKVCAAVVGGLWGPGGANSSRVPRRSWAWHTRATHLNSRSCARPRGSGCRAAAARQVSSRPVVAGADKQCLGHHHRELPKYPAYACACVAHARMRNQAWAGWCCQQGAGVASDELGRPSAGIRALASSCEGAPTAHCRVEWSEAARSTSRGARGGLPWRGRGGCRCMPTTARRLPCARGMDNQ